MHLRKLLSVVVLGALFCAIPVLAAPPAPAAARNAGLSPLTRVTLDLYNPRTRALQRVVRDLPEAEVDALRACGRPQLVGPSPRLLRNPAAQPLIRKLMKSSASTLDQPGRTPAEVQRLKTRRPSKNIVSGTWQAIALLVDFSDQDPISYPGSAAQSHFEDLLFSLGSYSTGSMRDYYREVSYNAFQVSGQVSGGDDHWYRAPRTLAYYTNGDSGTGEYPHNCQKLTEDVVDLADGDVDFSQYDNDHDGYVDALFIIHAGEDAAATGDGGDIWSHKWQITPRLKDGTYVSVYSVEPEDGKVGVFAHEFGHVLGLPDLYDVDYSSAGVGYWCLMAGGSWGADGLHEEKPAHLSPWCKAYLGWVTPTVVTANMAGASVPNTESSPVAYKLWKEGSPGTEYFLVENRAAVNFDQYLLCPGLLIWHIDERMTSNRYEWYPGRPASSHYLVALEQADGLWQLEHYLNEGDEADPWPGSSHKSAFNESSTPSSDAYTAGTTNVAVENIGFPAATATVDFRVFPSGVPEIGVSINAGAASTNSLAVTLTLSQLGDFAPLEMSFANDEGGSPGTWSSWEAWATTKAWTLASGAGTKTVWARARNASGTGGSASDSIRYLERVTISVTTPAGMTALGADNYATVSYTSGGVAAAAQVWEGHPVTVDTDGELVLSETSSASTSSHRWALQTGAVTAAARRLKRGGERAKDSAVTATYYEQYHKLFETQTQAPPLLTSSNCVSVSYTSFGAAASADAWDDMAADDAVWADAGCHYTYSRAATNSGDTERWNSETALGGTVTDAAAVQATVWHQYKPLLTFVGTDSEHTARLLSRALYGKQVLREHLIGNWSDWLDAGAEFSVCTFLDGSPRRVTADTASWTVSEELVATLQYISYFSIAGTIRNGAGAPMAGVSVTVGSTRTVTSETGYYVVHDLDAGSYTVTPHKLGYAFTPATRQVTVDETSGDAPGKGFTGRTIPSIAQWGPRGSAVGPMVAVTVVFSEPMARTATGNAFALQEMDLDTGTAGEALAGSVAWENDGCKLIFRPSSRLKPYHCYRATLGEGTRSAGGAALSAVFSWTFQTTDALALLSYGPSASKAACNSPITMVFDRDVNTASVREAFSVTPKIRGGLSFPNPRTARFTPAEALPLATEYRVRLERTAQGLDGVTLAQPFTWTFATQGAAAVMSATPAGTGAALSSNIVVTFDRAMDRALTRAAFSVVKTGTTTPLEGTVTWNDSDTALTFTPAQWLAKQTSYQIRVAASATSMQGAPLAADYQSSFTTANGLQVLAAAPRGTQVSPSAVIALQFDRPVLRDTLQVALTPAATGVLEWADDSNVVFRPNSPLTRNTRYTATVARTLRATDGRLLGAAYSWSFTTASEANVVSYCPRGTGVKPGAVITIGFDRAMDTDSVEGELEVWLEAATSTLVAGTASWSNGNRTLVFTPAARLAPYSDYHVILPRTARSADGLQLAARAEWVFQTMHCVAVTDYSPVGAGTPARSSIELSFGQAMHRSSVQGALTIVPAVAGHFEWPSASEVRYLPDSPLVAGRTYHLRLAAAARSAEGVTIGSPLEWTFTVAGAAAAALPTGVSAAQTGAGNVAISFALAAPAQVQVQVLNLAGRVVGVLAPSALLPAGANKLLWNGTSASGSRVPGGSYLVQVTSLAAAGGRSSAIVPLQLR